MKKHIRNGLLEIGAWHALSLARSIPEIVAWINHGCIGAAPHSIKKRIVKSYLARFALDSFVETGTYLGETLDYIAKTGVRCTSIELAPDLFHAACVRFHGRNNVKLLLGDSGVELPRLLDMIAGPTLFWLDGHYSAGITAGNDEITPIQKELNAILSHHISDHVVLIDDARCFDGSSNYPTLGQIARVVELDGRYQLQISTDIIRLTPRRVA